MWQAFELIHATFKDGAELYLEGKLFWTADVKKRYMLSDLSDMLPALDNFVAYGTDMLTQNPTYLAAIVSMVEDI